MQRFLRIVPCALVSLSLGILLGGFLRKPSPTAEAGQQAPCAARNGDSNGDGSLDLSDAVYLLAFLFQGGPGVAPLCPASPASLPATGQEKCWDGAVETLCTNPLWPGQDGSSRVGCPMQGRFTKNGDGTITDNCTGLMWQENAGDTNGDGSVTAADRLTWQEALQFVDDLSLGRNPANSNQPYTDWRLPNIHETSSILNYGTSPPLDPNVFSGPVDWYWSSTTNRAAPSQAFMVLADNVASGQRPTVSWPKTDARFTQVRAVRGP